MIESITYVIIQGEALQQWSFYLPRDCLAEDHSGAQGWEWKTFLLKSYATAWSF
jgi:hypothetical protein